MGNRGEMSSNADFTMEKMRLSFLCGTIALQDAAQEKML